MIIISSPTHVLPEVLSAEDKQRLQQQIADLNAKILLERELFGVPVKDLIGDPNYNLSDSICTMLARYGLLKQQPWPGYKVSHFSWLHDDFSVLSQADLLRVGWDLRWHQAFHTVTCRALPEQKEFTHTSDGFTREGSELKSTDDLFSAEPEEV